MKTVTINQQIWVTLASLLVLCAFGVAVTIHFERAVVARHDHVAEQGHNAIQDLVLHRSLIRYT